MSPVVVSERTDPWYCTNRICAVRNRYHSCFTECRSPLRREHIILWYRFDMSRIVCEVRYLHIRLRVFCMYIKNAPFPAVHHCIEGHVKSMKLFNITIAMRGEDDIAQEMQGQRRTMHRMGGRVE